jgi:hypothetical protein
MSQAPEKVLDVLSNVRGKGWTYVVLVELGDIRSYMVNGSR